MKIWIDACKNCNKEFENKSGHRQRPSVYCSVQCKNEYREKIRKETGYYAKRKENPEIKLRIRKQALKYARSHPEVLKRWQKDNPEKRKIYRARIDAKKHGYAIEFATVKYEVRKRDNETCRDCGCNEKERMAVHHIDKNKQNSSLENLVTLCRTCHGLRHRDVLIKYRTPKKNMVIGEAVV